MGHFSVKMHRSVTAADSVVSVGVNCHIELNTSLYHFFGELVGVLRVNIVISRTMNDK